MQSSPFSDVIKAVAAAIQNEYDHGNNDPQHMWEVIAFVGVERLRNAVSDAMIERGAKQINGPADNFDKAQFCFEEMIDEALSR